jgi:hypothetical protein
LPWRRQRRLNGIMRSSALVKAIGWPGQFVRAVRWRSVLGTRLRDLSRH